MRKNIIFSSNRNEKDTLKLLQDIGISLGEKDYWYEQLTPLKKKCCQRAFLRGVFLGCGSVADPNRSYHLEMVLKENIIADELCEFMISNEMNAKIIDRKNMAVVYLKEAEDISLFFNIIGAHKAMLEFEDITIMKDMRNGVNRVTNCELANLNKTLECWERQVECINLLKKKGVFESLSPKLIEIAEVRLANPEFSLAEVGKALSEPLGRSGVNHRLKKLEEMANCLK